jgi:cellobiose phosphorylase
LSASGQQCRVPGIAGKDAPTFGEAKNSWLTGTAAWNYYAIMQWILGVRTTLDGLEIAPVIPKSWPGFTATRTFRGVVYNIAIERKGEGNSITLIVDGVPIQGNIVPPPLDGQKKVSIKGVIT